MTKERNSEILRHNIGMIPFISMSEGQRKCILEAMDISNSGTFNQAIEDAIGVVKDEYENFIFDGGVITVSTLTAQIISRINQLKKP
jgi:hypothetical protein